MTVVRQLLDRGRSDAGVISMGLTNAGPTTAGETELALAEGFSIDGPHYRAASARISDGYLETIGVPLKQGRMFTTDDIRAGGVIIVDEALAARLWPGRSAIGQRLALHVRGTTNAPSWVDVVGVVGSIRHPLSEGDVRPFAYMPISTSPDDRTWEAGLLVARSRRSDAEMLTWLRNLVKEVDPDTPLRTAQPLEASIDFLRYPRRIATTMLSSSAVLGLLLAAFGLYGIVAYSVAQRMRELGIRAALGARRIDLIRLVVRDGLITGVVGTAVGLALAIAAFRFASHQVYAIPPLDWLTAAAVCLLLFFVVVLACYLPARSAGRADPVVALREQ